MKYHFKNLVFEGGGVKGIAYVGALEELGKRGILDNIERVGGTSAGAINALLVALNYSEDETKKILWELDFNNFMDDSWGILRDTRRLLKKYGWYKGDFFRKWIGERIALKTGNPNSTFEDIEKLKKKRSFKSLFVVGTNLSTGYSEVFSYMHTPRTCVADAIRISMSIPVFFKAVKGPRKDIYVDGGLLRNYPVKLFDREKYKPDFKKETEYYNSENKSISSSERPISQYIYNKETLGFRLDEIEEISVFRDQAEPRVHKIRNFFDFLWRLAAATIEDQQSSHLHSDDWQRTIYIDTLKVKTTQFDLSDNKKKDLVLSGKKGVREYFEWFDSPESSPANRP